MDLLVILISLLATGGFIAGAILFGLGICGRKLDRHPVCKRCKYDLMGIPHFSPRCPECGSLLLSTTVVIGNRQRRQRFILIGLGLMIVIGVLTGSTVQSGVAADLGRYRPVWWLRAELKSPVPFARRSAAEELTRRLVRGELETETQTAIADAMIDRLEDTTFLEALDSRHGLSAIQLDRLTQQLVHAEFAASAASESQIHFRVSLPPYELGMCEEPRGMWSPTITNVELDGSPVKSMLAPLPKRGYRDAAGDVDLDAASTGQTHELCVSGTVYWVTPRGGCILLPFKFRQHIAVQP